MVGGTATDVRADGISVTEQFFNECSVFPYTLGDAVSDGLIQLPWYIAADVTPPSEELMQWASDEDKRILKDIKTVDEVGVKDWKEALNSVYPGFEINIIPITSKHLKNQKYIQSLHKRPNAVDAFLCVDMMSQGHPFDDLTGIVMQRKTSSPVKYTQQIGRCMSVANFNDMFVLDLVGNFINDFRVENPLAAVYRQIAAHQLLVQIGVMLNVLEFTCLDTKYVTSYYLINYAMLLRSHSIKDYPLYARYMRYILR